MGDQLRAPAGMFSVVLFDSKSRDRYPQGLDFDDLGEALTKCSARNHARRETLEAQYGPGAADPSRFIVIDDQGIEREYASERA